MVSEDLVTAEAVAEALDISVGTILSYTRNRKIPCVEFADGQLGYRLSEVLIALAGSTTGAKSVHDNADSHFTYQDYLQLPDEPGFRYEVLAGELFKQPAPDFVHQWVSGRLHLVLALYFAHADPCGVIVCSLLAVTLEDINVLQPDILYVSGDNLEIIKDTRIDGAPTLLVEIISPSSRRKDRLDKMRIYLQSGVEHYWLVDPSKQTLECFALREGRYTLAAAGRGRDIFGHPAFPGLQVSLSGLWWRELED